jgi:hypothetical protein
VGLAVAVGLGLLVVLVTITDGRELWRTASSLEPLELIVPLVLALASYAAMARSYQGIARAADCVLPFRTWLRITFVSNTANYLVTSAGLSGFAVRMYLLSQQGVPRGRCVLISLVQTFLTNFTLLFFILVGFITLVTRSQTMGVALGAASVAVALFTGVLVTGVVLVAHRRLRRRTLLWLANVIHRVLRRVAPHRTPRRVRLWRSQHNLNEGLEFLLARKEQIAWPTFWIMLDWVLTLGILWWAFRAVHHPISPGLVMIGFAVGILLSLVSLVPGGLGVMEGSMAAVFVSLGVPLESAVVAVLIFRIAYYVFPLLVSLFLFHGVLRQATRATAPV